MGKKEKKMKAVYFLRSDVITDESGKKYTVYGVDLRESCDPAAAILKSVPDIFFDLEEAQNFVNTCNALQLNPIHLMDVIEDVLA